MKYIMNRTVITADNKTLEKGANVAGVVSQEILERWAKDGIVSVVESPSEFSEKINKRGKKADPEVEALDPDAQPRSK